MVEEVVVVNNEVGLHARPAAVFVQTASAFESKVTLEANGKIVNGKSILQVLLLGAKKGHSVLIRAEGSDEADAVRALSKLVRGGMTTE